MSELKQLLTQLGHQAEQQFDALKARLVEKLGGPAAVKIVPYYGHGTPETLYVRGRVLADNGLQPATNADTLWDNLLATYRRLESDEIAGVRVRATFQHSREAVSTDVITDEEGYFLAELRLPRLLKAQNLWHPVHLQLLDKVPPNQGTVETTASVLVPPPQSSFGIISDIDDTILQTHATDLLQVARVTFLQNARTRLPFAGVAAFYQALQQGSNNSSQNPIFYVSSSPWNLYDLLTDFMAFNAIPAGPLFLRDVGLTATTLLAASNHDHKIAQIRHIMETHRQLPFILIGDSGQQDPEIYYEVAQTYPERIRAVYIRDMSDGARDAEVQQIIDNMKTLPVAMHLVPDTFVAAKDAAAQGFIAQQSLPHILAEKEKDT